MTDLNARIPSGSDVAQRTAMKPAFSDDLLESVLSKANLQQAWKQVRANRGAAGVDGMTIGDFPAWVKAGHWSVVEQSIRSGDYQLAPVRRVEIDKPDGGKRELGIPTVIDRVIQQAIEHPQGRETLCGGCGPVEVLRPGESRPADDAPGL